VLKYIVEKDHPRYNLGWIFFWESATDGCKKELENWWKNMRRFLTIESTTAGGHLL